MSETAAGEPTVRRHGNAYLIFILVATLLALLFMVLLLLPVDDATRTTLLIWDSLLCAIFIVDFIYNLTGSRPRSEYFIHERGWLDLIGSIPTFGIYQLTILLRLARVSRLVWIGRKMGKQRRRELVADVLDNRGQYAFSFTMLLILVVISISSIVVLQFEGAAPNGNIRTGGDALWWAIVTICTVGYGDYYPVTTLGRITGTFVMFSGVAIIGALASIAASVLISPKAEAAQPTDEVGELRRQLDLTQAELAALKESVAAGGKST